MSETLEQVLADERGDASVLRARGHPHDADLIERLCRRVQNAAEDYLRWLSEDDAMLRSDHARPWFRRRFPEWERQGHARTLRGTRYYRQVVVPTRANESAAYEAGKRAARGAREREDAA